VISDLHGVSGRKILDAMIAGQRDPRVLADLAHGRMRVKLPQLRQALTGCFDDHHGFLCAVMLRRIDTLTADIAILDARIDEFIDLVGHIAGTWSVQYRGSRPQPSTGYTRQCPA
jgi:transposase